MAPRPRASTSSVTWPIEQPLEPLEVRDVHGDFSVMDLCHPVFLGSCSNGVYNGYQLDIIVIKIGVRYPIHYHVPMFTDCVGGDGFLVSHWLRMPWAPGFPETVVMTGQPNRQKKIRAGGGWSGRIRWDHCRPNQEAKTQGGRQVTGDLC